MQAEFQKLNDELFGDGTGVHTVGKGKVYAGQSLTDVLQGVEPGAGLRLHQTAHRTRRFSLCIASWLTPTSTSSTIAATRRDSGCELPRDRQGARIVVCRDRQVASLLLTTSRMAAPRCRCIWSLGARCSLCSASQRRPPRATLPKQSRIATGDGGWPVERELPAGPWRAGIGHARQAYLVERQRGQGREVLLRRQALTRRRSRRPRTGSSRVRSCGSIWVT